MLSKKSILWILPTILLLAFGIMWNIWQLFIILVPILVFYSMFYLLSLQDPKLNINRLIEKAAVIDGDNVSVNLQITNRGNSIPMVEVSDKIPQETFVIEGVNKAILPISAGETVRLKYTLKVPLRGKYTLGPTYFRTGDIVQMNYQEMVIHNEETFTVMPRTEDLRRVKIKPNRLRNWTGIVQSRQIGIGSEFSALREYVPGDDRKHINWKASAHWDRLISNDFESEKCGDIIVIVDARDNSGLGTIRSVAVETGVKAALTISSKIIKDMNRVGLITTGQYLDWVYPGYGRGQFYKIVDKLTHLAPGGTWTIDYLKWVLVRFFPPKTQLIIISPLLDKKILEIIIDLYSMGFSMTVLSPNSLDSEMRLYPHSEEYSTAYSLLKMERELSLSEIREYVKVIDWDIDEPLEAALMEVRRH